MNNTVNSQLMQQKESIITKPIFIISIILFIFLSIAYIADIRNIGIKGTENEEIQTALAAEAGFSPSLLSQLHGDLSDLDRAEYKEIKNSLVNLAHQRNEIRFAYIYIQRNGKIYFLADSEPSDSKDYSPPGQEYLEANDETFLPFQNGQPLVSKPVSDRWGTWVSVLVPMKDMETGKTVAVFGVDYPAESWNNHVVALTIQAGILVFCVLLIFVALYTALTQNKKLRREKRKLLDLDAKLRESEMLFRTIFDQAPIGIAIGHSDTNTISTSDNWPTINPMFEKIIGRTEEELKNVSWDEITHPDDSPMDLENFAKFKSGEIGGYEMDKRYIKPDGSEVWVHMMIAPLQFNYAVAYDHLCLIEDISNHKELEKALYDSERSKAILLDNLPGMAYRCCYDREWTMQSVSQGCFELTGYKAESLLSNKERSFNDLISPQYQEHLWNRWAQVLAEHSKLTEEYELVTASGQVKWVWEQGQGIYDETGNVLALEGLIMDITERKKQEMEILYINHHDYLTGLYNRRYFDEEMKRLDQEDCLPLSVMIGSLNGIRLINNAFGHEQGDLIIQETAKIVKGNCCESYIIARTGGDEFSVLMPKTDRQSALDIMQTIKAACETYNKHHNTSPYSVNIALGCSTKNTTDENILRAYKDAGDYMYKRKLLERKSSHGAIMTSIMATLFAKSQETEIHAERLSVLSRTIGLQLGLPQKSLILLELFAMLHDVGKMGIDDRVLNKPGKLNEEEWAVMKKHPEIGYRIAMSSSELEPIAEYILTHHERWDGKGYPQGLAGEDIPLLSRILAVADSYDAMTEDRVYRKAMSKEEAVMEIQKNSGTQFDPQVVKAFEEIINEQSIVLNNIERNR